MPATKHRKHRGSSVVKATQTEYVTLHFVVADPKRSVTAARCLKTDLITTYYPEFRDPRKCYIQAQRGFVTFRVPIQLRDRFVKTMTSWIDGIPTWKLGKRKV